MYARYIPPQKGASQASKFNQVSETPAAPTSKPTATAYARYVPSAKPNNKLSPQPLPSDHVRFSENIEDSEDGPPAKKARLSPDGVSDKPKKESKKSKKSKKRDSITKEDAATQEHSEEPLEAAGPFSEVEGHASVQTSPDLPGEEPSIPPDNATRDKEAKREKKKQKKKRSEDAIPDSELATPRRHRAVLEKAAKSIQKASENPAAAPDTSTEDHPMHDAAETNDSAHDQGGHEEEVELHGLEPLPQPEPVAVDASTPMYETLPPWLAAPIRVSQHASTQFTQMGLSPDLGISPDVAKRLSAKGYKDAFAIQTGVIPLLLPHHCKTMQGDVLVSAATGSGKTLSYALPMIRDISNGNRHVTRLRGLVVLPTRELVKQVQQVCEQCAGVFALDGAKKRARIAIAMGSQSLEQEQNTLIEREERYDPGAYSSRKNRLTSLGRSASDTEGEDLEDEEFKSDDEERAAIRKAEAKIPTLPDHVVAYRSKVDVLICTPGRLVEHIKYTPGFTLDFVRWLVVDEADKVLGQNFQQWLKVVIPRLHTQKLPGSRNHKQSNLSGVRKVVLSATMTRDLDQLEGLRLRRPKLVVLEGSETDHEPRSGRALAEHALPELLEENALKVSDPNLKPLFLLDLLRSDHLLQRSADGEASSSSDDDTSSSASDSDSESDSDLQPSNKAAAARSSGRKELQTVLIFTKSNETALRLSRLLSLLAPGLGALIGTLTSTTPYTTRRDTMRNFNAGKLRVLVASDLVARGIDLPSLDHVINYDMPTSVASYVHRVGRTARAGKSGKAWTLFTNPEARWFWNEVASPKAIQRSGAVNRLRVTEEKEDAFADKVAEYEAALEKLGQEAGQGRH
ncbi:P-loop containing nucleoside triphosphate hydrolase protein [Xylariomycetidae sp. FL0641]|nr:P-loop containing nucleoside triphosphate hydrolase protein [Xylariomycetidae sp. FL0641]